MDPPVPSDRGLFGAGRPDEPQPCQRPPGSTVVGGASGGKACAARHVPDTGAGVADADGKGRAGGRIDDWCHPRPGPRIRGARVAEAQRCDPCG